MSHIDAQRLQKIGGELLSSLFEDDDQLVSCMVACSYLQELVQALVHFLVVVHDAKMLKNLCLEFLEDKHISLQHSCVFFLIRPFLCLTSINLEGVQSGPQQ
jgi:hypothetical protein